MTKSMGSCFQLFTTGCWRKVTLATLSSPEEYYNRQPSNLKGTLSGLSDGNHSLKFYFEGVSYYDPYQVQGISNYYVKILAQFTL